MLQGYVKLALFSSVAAIKCGTVNVFKVSLESDASAHWRKMKLNSTFYSKRLLVVLCSEDKYPIENSLHTGY